MNNPRGPPPPPPVETKNQGPVPRNQSNAFPKTMQFTERPTNRPDISASRGEMFREEGLDVGNSFASVNEPMRSMAPPSSMPRPEMRGPQNTDIDNILAGLKTRTVDIHAAPPAPQQMSVGEDDSMISISSLRDTQNGNLPKRTNTRRKQRSDKNIVSLDI